MTLTLSRVEGDVIRIGMSTWQGRAAGYAANAYVLRGVLVDSGFARVRGDLLRAVADLAPRGAVITHWHEDHSGNAPGLAARSVPILMHPACEQTLRERPRLRAYRRIVWGRPSALRDPLLPFDPSPLRVIEAPGHTADHLVVYDDERGILASGEEATALLLAKAVWLEDTIGNIMSLAGRGLPAREIQRRVLGPEALVGYVSFGEYSGRALVQAVLGETDEPR